MRLSINRLVVILLLVLVIAFVVVSAIGSVVFQQAAFTAQGKTLDRIIGIAVSDSITKISQLGKELGNDIQNDKALIRQLRTVLKGKEPSSAITVMLDSYYARRFVTTGLLSLEGLQVYDSKLELIAVASKDSYVRKSLPDLMKAQALGRTGKARYQPIEQLFVENGKAYLSVLMPLGGFRLLGYIHIVLDPAYNLQDIAETLSSPIKITAMNNE